ncbi:hypothetical protein ACWDYH_15325 [Nocardia goodfellowii]
MDTCDRDLIEIQVIQDVLDVVETQLVERERCGWQLTVPRARLYAIVLHAVIVSARAGYRIPATLDGADILDVILDGIEPADLNDDPNPVEEAIRNHTAETEAISRNFGPRLCSWVLGGSVEHNRQQGED